MGVSRERIPVMVRAGSVVPLDDGWAHPDGPCALHGDSPLTAGAGGAVALDHSPRLLAFHCWPSMHRARGTAYDDAGDGHGPHRLDALEVSGVEPGGTAVVRWQRHGGYPAPEVVRFVLHGFEAAAAEADGEPVTVRAGTVECGPFDELRLENLRSAPGSRA